MTRTLTAILELRRAGRVQRCHGIPYHGSYSVAEHTYQMLNLLMSLCPKPSKALIEAILYHDSAELEIGDTPRPAKTRFPDLGKAVAKAEEVVNSELSVMQDKLLPSELAWLRGLDLLELAMWCLDQLDMGNKNVMPVLDRCHDAIQEQEMPEEIREFLKLGVLR